jgi:hypothetical protein
MEGPDADGRPDGNGYGSDELEVCVDDLARRVVALERAGTSDPASLGRLIEALEVAARVLHICLRGDRFSEEEEFRILEAL